MLRLLLPAIPIALHRLSRGRRETSPWGGGARSLACRWHVPRRLPRCTSSERSHGWAGREASPLHPPDEKGIPHHRSSIPPQGCACASQAREQGSASQARDVLQTPCLALQARVVGWLANHWVQNLQNLAATSSGRISALVQAFATALAPEVAAGGLEAVDQARRGVAAAGRRRRGWRRRDRAPPPRACHAARHSAPP